eukprot:TCONS_00054602-protein
MTMLSVLVFTIAILLSVGDVSPLSVDCGEHLDDYHLSVDCLHGLCSEGRFHYIGCKRTCDNGSSFVCPQKEYGCWCPQGYAENEKEECVPLSKCPCRVGDKVYQPGQTVVRSLCTTCTCFSGSMICYEVCIV